MVQITRTEWNKLKKHGYTAIIKGKPFALINSALVPVTIAE